jgi:hypothetical protein
VAECTDHRSFCQETVSSQIPFNRRTHSRQQFRQSGQGSTRSNVDTIKATLALVTDEHQKLITEAVTREINTPVMQLIVDLGHLTQRIRR